MFIKINELKEKSMKYIAIFEDRKGFSTVLEFAQLPHKYDFVERQPPSVMSIKNSEVTPHVMHDKKITFLPHGKTQEVNGQIVQKYFQE